MIGRMADELECSSRIMGSHERPCNRYHATVMAGPRRPRTRSTPPVSTVAPETKLVPLGRGAWALVLGVATLCALACVTYSIYDPDLWQHLTVGREIWRTHSVPHTQLWTWPTHGAPDVLPSWLFRALLWPFWEWGGVNGVFVWRWLTTLVTFVLLGLATRRAGGTGLAPIVALVWCAVLWRARSQARPETFAAILVAAELLLLEARRAAQRDGRPSRHAWGIVPIALLWANAHISYYLGFVLAGGYLLDDLLRRRGHARELALAVAAAAAASFVNPFGWRALAQPFEYFLRGRHEPIYSTIGELQPIDWSVSLANGLPLFLLLLVAGAILHARRNSPDWAQVVILGLCLPQALASQRFVGYLAVCAAPFFARDIGAMLSGVRWPASMQGPWRRAALAAIACMAVIAPDLTRPGVGLGLGFVWNQYPVRACDWIETHDIRGRAFNPFSYGGYLLWRFYPDSTRLPFMDIHQAGTPRIRYEYAWAAQDSVAWHALDGRWRFDWIVMMRGTAKQTGILDVLDADSAWALGFADDVAAVYLRRDGRCAEQARELGFRWLPGGTRALDALGERAWSDTTVRRQLATEVERAIGQSNWTGRAHALAANLALQDGRWSDAASHLREAMRFETGEKFLRARLGFALLGAGDAAGALREFEAEARADRSWREADLRRAQALQILGRLDEARSAYERAASEPATSAEARDSLNSPHKR
jgi:hypothetical protein